MTADFFEYFYTDKYDDKVLLKSSDKIFTVFDVKKLVKRKIDFLSSVEAGMVRLSADDTFEFIINFFACIFAGKEIFLSNQPEDDYKISTRCQVADEDFAEFKKIKPEDVMITFLTSGSSGEKKEIKKSLLNLLKEGSDLAEEFGFVKGLEFISTTTLNHLFGMTFHLMLPLNCEGVINTDRIHFPENIKGENLVLVSSPSFLGKMSKYEEKCALNTIITAGAKLEDEVFNYALTISQNMVEIYGSTETGIMAFRRKPQDNLRLFKNVSLTMHEYFANVTTPYSIEKEEVINDALEMVSEDEIKFLGRTDRILKIQEKRISAEEIENTLSGNEYVQEAYCLKFGEKLACLTALNKKGMDFIIQSGVVKLKEILKTFLEDKFEIIPQKWKFIDEIPKTLSGKIDAEKIENIFNLNLSLPLVMSRKYEPNAATYKLYFYRNCNFFKGHFPDFPILPGVVQLLYASIFAKDAFGISCTSGQFRRIKFSNLLKPDKIVNLRLELSERGVGFTYFHKEKICSSGLLPIKNYWR